MIMQKSKQYPKQHYRLSPYVRRIKIILYLVIVFAFLHISQTGLFLVNHFTEDENRSDMIKLDMNIWQGNDQSRRRIPRYIHQIWISSENDEEMYKKFQTASNACIDLHSNYNYTLWTHKKILIWLKMHYSWFLPVYQNYRYDMQRIDAMKYLLLLHFGGIYLDLDVKCKVPDLITAMLPLDKRGIEPDIIFHMGTEGISANTDIIAAKQSHPFFKLAVSQLKSANRWFYLYHLTIILSAGPTFLHGIYLQFPFKDHFYYIPNHLLYGKLIEGVGGGTWYGKDSLFFIHLMENKFSASFLLFFIISFFFVGFRFLKKKRYW
jgi:mannosyltransferase OCH1-like enzyme